MLICINPKTYNLTKFKAYEQINESDGKIVVINDNGKRTSYTVGLFRTVNPITPKESKTKLNYCDNDSHGTTIINTKTGRIGKVRISDDTNIAYRVNSNGTTEETLLSDAIFAHKLGICEDDEKKPKPIRKLIQRIDNETYGKNIVFNDHSYTIMQLNGNDKVVLKSRATGHQKRVKRQELLNNEKCYEG